ncbi:MAG: NAD-dependent epimerase/dehydratase family protein [Candidatus Jacksonbacteria bacterium]|nr:NAD-dependent epimerase/dehydratase family protein [Candidatus Jacksonbacteria bacterium]
MKIIITGGAGFIGSSIARELVKRKHSVKIIDNLATGRLENLKGIEKRAVFIKGDVRNFSLLKRECMGFDAIFHHAAFISVSQSISKPLISADHNINGTRFVLEAARHARMQGVMFASSCAVYGSQARGTKTSERHSLSPLSPYALSKIIGEQCCKLYTKIYNLPTVVLRYFNVYGPGQNFSHGYQSAIPCLTRKLIKGEKPVIYGTGEQTRDFIYIDDVISANLKAISSLETTSGKTFNIGSGTATTINRLLAIIRKNLSIRAINFQKECIYKEKRDGDVNYIRANLSQSKTLLGFKPTTSITEGIGKYIDWMKRAVP